MLEHYTIIQHKSGNERNHNFVSNIVSLIYFTQSIQLAVVAIQTIIAYRTILLNFNVNSVLDI